ncbi:Protein kinase-like domain containing protein [Rhypophila sp. PSN 637]
MTSNPAEIEPGRAVVGQRAVYIVEELLYSARWVAVHRATDRYETNAIIKVADYLARLQSEQSLLNAFAQTDDEYNNRCLILEYLDSDMNKESFFKRLSRAETKQVAKSVLQAMEAIHEKGYIHGDVKKSNVFVNLGKQPGEPRFTAIKLGDFSSSVVDGSYMARQGFPVGTPLSRSPESHLRLPSGQPTDIWSFGNLIISLVYGNNYSIFRQLPSDMGAHDQNDFTESQKILRRMYHCFGPFPGSFVVGVEDDNMLDALAKIHALAGPTTLFSEVSPRGPCRGQGLHPQDHEV